MRQAFLPHLAILSTLVFSSTCVALAPPDFTTRPAEPAETRASSAEGTSLVPLEWLQRVLGQAQIDPAEWQKVLSSLEVRDIQETIRKAVEEARKSSAWILNSPESEGLEKGNPFSARELRSFRQTLADGTVIVRQSTRLLARDGEGRLRQELRHADGTARIVLNDTVARVAYFLDPQRQLACRAPFDKEALLDCFNRVRGDWKPLGFTLRTGPNGVGLLTARDDVTVQVSPLTRILDLTMGSLRGESKGMPSGNWLTSRLREPTEPSVTGASVQFSRSQQSHEGLRVEVERRIETIPAGLIGNSRPLELVDERHYSPELRLPVFLRRADPRHGESLMRMTDIRRGEPDPSQFVVPPGYTIIEAQRK